MSETPEPNDAAPSLAEALGRRAGRFVKTARPKLQRAAIDAKPKLESAARAAGQYARDHEDEIKNAATSVVKMRLPGPLRPAIDAIVSKASPAPAPNRLECPRCRHDNPASARFCNQCGAALA